MYQVRPTCFLCGRNGGRDPLDVHHLFGGAYRRKSEKYGLTVLLCHERCHIFGSEAAHSNPETMHALHVYGQRLAMERFGWDEDDFRREFGKSYLTEDEAQEIGQTVGKGGFALTDEVFL